MVQQAVVNLNRIQLISMLLVMLACMVMPITVAFNVGVMMEQFGVSPRIAGLVATVDGLVAAGFSLITSRFINKFTTRQFFLVAMAIISCAHALSAFSTSVYWLMLFQAFAGAGVGIGLAVVLSTTGRTANPEMTMGFINSSIGATIILLGLTVPQAIGAAGLKGAYLTYATIALIGFFVALLGPNVRAPDPDVKQVKAAPAFGGLVRRENIPILVALVGIGFFFIAQAGLGAFVERIGKSAGITLEQFGLIVAVGGLLTIIGPLIAGKIGARFGATLPLCTLMTAMCIATFGLAVITSPMSFYIATPLFALIPSLFTPTFTGALARLDHTGRTLAMYPAFTTLGGAIGPYFGGSVVETSGFGALGLSVIGIFIIATLMMAAATMKADKASFEDAASLKEQEA